MAQLQSLPDKHTDFVFSLEWESGTWVLALLVLAAVVIAVFMYRRRRRK
jgi:LPXTG-motif cell wall-anchored protein